MGARDVQAAAPRDEKAERGDTAIAAVPLAAVPTDAVPRAESLALAPRSLPVALRLRPVGTGASPRGGATTRILAKRTISRCQEGWHISLKFLSFIF